MIEEEKITSLIDPESKEFQAFWRKDKKSGKMLLYKAEEATDDQIKDLFRNLSVKKNEI